MQSNRPGILRSLRDYFWNPSYTPETPTEEQRGNFSFGDWGSFVKWLNGDQEDYDSGETITERKAQRLDTVFNCLNRLGQDVAKTESPIKQEKDGYKQVIKTHPSYKLLNVKANRFMTAYTWKYITVFHMLGWGNAYSGIIRDEFGTHLEYVPLMPWETEVQVIDGDIFYLNNGIAHPQRDVLHFKMFTEDGVNGLSPLMWNAKAMGYKIKQDRYSVRSIGVKPPGFLSGTATGPQFESNVKQWNNHMSGPDPTGIPYLTGDNLKFNSLMIPPNEGQHLETKQYTDVKICGMYSLNISKIGFTENIKYDNLEQNDISHVKDALVPIFTAIEQELDCKIFTEENYDIENPLYVKFNLWSNIRADLKTRGEFYSFMRKDGVFNADEIRGDMDRAPIPNELGQTYYIQGAMMPLETQKDAALNKGQVSEERMFQLFDEYAEGKWKREENTTVT